MIDTATIETLMRDANPIPNLDDVDADELASAVAAVHTRRAAAMQAPTQYSPTTTTSPAPQRRRKAWAFAAAFIVVLLLVGAAALFLQDDTPVADEPAPAEPTEIESLSLIWSRVPRDDAVFAPEVGEAAWMEGVTAGGPGFVAVGWAGETDSRAAVWTSTDGNTWSAVPYDASVFGTRDLDWEMRDVTVGGPGLVAVGRQPLVMGWIDRTDEEIAEIERTGQEVPWYEIKAESEALVWTSQDGISWTRVPHDPDLAGGDMHSVIQGGPGLIAVGSVAVWSDPGVDVPVPEVDYETAAGWTSPDGITWSLATVSDRQAGVTQSTVMADVTLGGPGFVAVGSDESSAAVWTSPDGEDWARVPHDESVFGGDGYQMMGAVVEGGPGLVAVGGDDGHGAVWTSTDGYVWTRVPPDEPTFGRKSDPEWRQGFGDRPPMADVVVVESGFVAVGSIMGDINVDFHGNTYAPGGDDPLVQAAVWTSPDGVAWSRVPHDQAVFGEGDKLRPMVHMEGVIVGGPGLIAVGSSERGAGVWVAEY